MNFNDVPDGNYEIHQKIIGGVFDPNLGCIDHKNISDGKFELHINKPTREEIAVDSAWEINR